MPSDPKAAGAAPGLSLRRDKAGNVTRRVWICSATARSMGYRPKTVPVFEEDAAAIASRCRNLQAEMLQWIAERTGAAEAHQSAMAGSLNALIREYRLRESSPYKAVKWNTRQTYDQVLDQIEAAVGKKKIASITLDDVVRWYDAARYPEGKGRGKPDRVRKAHGMISMLRRVMSYGVAIEMPHCDRVRGILSAYRFEAPKARGAALQLAHVEAIRTKAHEAGRASIALGTAIQFELMLRQRDVIGEWEPIEDRDAPASPYRLNGRQWANGLTWANISDDWLLTKATTKTGQVVSFDLTTCPMALEELQRVPDERRFGPLIIDEPAGRPYATDAYHREWRKIADAAKVPKGVWNMDARAGGATEAEDAGVDPQDLRPAMGHSQVATTARYMRGSALEPARRVATLRVAHRAKQNAG